MTFERILSLLKANQNDSDWGHTEIDNVWISFCLADVNLRLEFRVIWQDRKPFMNFVLKYSATPVLTFSFPVAGNDVSSFEFKAVLNKATERMSVP